MKENVTFSSILIAPNRKAEKPKKQKQKILKMVTG
jgi:hypothetical protein